MIYHLATLSQKCEAVDYSGVLPSRSAPVDH